MPSTESERTVALIAYVLHMVGAIAALPSIVGLIMNYMKRRDSGVLFESHHSWMIRSFWWGLLWVVVGAVAILIVIGWFVLIGAWLWYVYRHVRGLLALLDERPMPH